MSFSAASEWREAALANISSDVSYGYTESASTEKVGPHFLRITDIQNGVVDWSSVPYCPITKENHKKYRLANGDIVVARTGNSTGENFLFQGNEDAVFASYLIRFRIDREQADPKFVWYNLRSHGWWSFISNSKTGSAQAGANAKVLGGFQVRLPALEEQRIIAHILGTLDDKIELNRKQNETLEAMAHALFKAWFVDFEPVRAKCRGEFQTRPYQWPQHILDLFPDRLVESELGEIPEGWHWASASEVIQFNPTEPLRKGTVVPYLDMAALPTIGSWPEPPVLREFGSGMRFRNGDTLLARITPCLENGKTAFVQCLPQGTLAWGSTEFIVLRPKAPVPAEYAYLLARDSAFREHAIRSMTGTSGRQRVQADSVAEFKVVSPLDVKIWKVFADFVAPLFKDIKANSEASQTLAQLRDTLLPKLISGELRVLDAEVFLKERGL